MPSHSDRSEAAPLRRRQPRGLVLPQRISDDELARCWSLSAIDLGGLKSIRAKYWLANAIQLCALRLFGQFLKDPTHAPPRIVAHLSTQLGQPAPLFVESPGSLYPKVTPAR